MNPFSIGERVALKSCTDSPGQLPGLSVARSRCSSTTSVMTPRKHSGRRVCNSRKGGSRVAFQKVMFLEHAFCALATAKNQSLAEQPAATFLEHGSKGD
jgi:hypothetical protein